MVEGDKAMMYKQTPHNHGEGSEVKRRVSTVHPAQLRQVDKGVSVPTNP